MQTEFALQFNEHESVHWMLQVEPSLQSILALVPTTRSQVEPPLQSTVHDAPQLPVHSLSLLQSSEQLFPLQPESPRSQDVPAGQSQVEPVHSGGGGESLPHATRKLTRMSRKCMPPRYQPAGCRIVYKFCATRGNYSFVG